MSKSLKQNNRIEPSPVWYSILSGSTRFAWFLVITGILLRLWRYLGNRSLRIDEARLALNIINRSFVGLFEPLDYNQNAPVGFLLLQKFIVNVLGNQEFILRLIPLAAGILSLPLFYIFVRRLVNKSTALLALSFVVFSRSLVLYTSEVKQYSSDVMVELIIMIVGLKILIDGITASRLVFLGFLGIITVWFSHPAMFILAGVCTALIIYKILDDQKHSVIALIGVTACWGMSFLINYFMNLRAAGNNQNLSNYWACGFIPFPPTSISDMKWYFEKFLELFTYTDEFAFIGLAVMAFVLGCIQLYRKNKRLFWMLLSPLPFALIASALSKFPFTGRLILYVIPIVMLFVAAGIEFVMKTGGHRNMLTGVVMSVLLLFSLAIHVIPPPEEWNRIETRPALSFIKQQIQKDDILYVHARLYEPFLYYSNHFDLNNTNVKFGNKNSDNQLAVNEELERLKKYERVWILIPNLSWPEKTELRPLFQSQLDRLGTKLNDYSSTGVSIYLYDLKQKD